MHPQLVRYSPRFIHIKGVEIPRHLQIAYGRYVVRLCHVSRDEAFDAGMRHLYMVDSPAAVGAHPHAVDAYRAEMARLKIPVRDWVNAALPSGMSHFRDGSIPDHVAGQCSIEAKWTPYPL